MAQPAVPPVREVEDLVNASLEKLRRRNSVQTSPFHKISQGYTKLWNQNRALEQQHLEMRRQVVIVQREAAEITASLSNEEGSEASSAAIENLRSTLQRMHDDLKEKTEEEDLARKIKADLGRKVSEQNTLILDLQEELRISKTELSSCRENISILTKELELSKHANDAIKAEIDNVRSLCASSEAKTRALEIENAKLVERIMTEKEKMVEEMNRMNFKTESVKASSSSTSILSSIFSGKSDKEPKLASPAPVRLANIRDDYVSVEEAAEANVASNMGIPATPWKALQTSSTGGALVEINDIDSVYNDKYIAVAGSDSCIRVFDILQLDYPGKNRPFSRAQPIAKFEAKNSPVFSLSSKGGEFIIAGYSDKCCRIWSMKSSKMVTQLSGHNARVTCVKWIGSSSGFSAKAGSPSPSGKASSSSKVTCHERAISVSADRTIRIWDVESSRAIVTIQADSAINSVDVTSDGNSCVTGHKNGHVQYWDISSGKCVGDVAAHTSSITSVSFGARGDFSKALACSMDNSCSVIDCYTYRPYQTLSAVGFRPSCEWSKASFCYHSNNKVAAGSADGSIFIWNTDNGNVVATLNKEKDTHSAAVIASVWSRYGLLTSDRQGKVALWH